MRGGGRRGWEDQVRDEVRDKEVGVMRGREICGREGFCGGVGDLIRTIIRTGNII